jgi:cobalt/nickel transport system permease protein
MHIPDGFLDAKTAGVTAALSALAVSAALRRLKKKLPRRKIPLMGLSAAFLFVAQMINFPVGGGTSGHLLGGVLSAVLLGPAEALVVMVSVLLVQCFLFADGGLVALGANVFNMGIIGTLFGYGLYTALVRVLPGERWAMVALAVAAWCSTVLAALCCTGELAWSGTVVWNAAIVPMAGVHMLIGLGEALITVLVVKAISATRPEILMGTNQGGQHRGVLVAFGFAIVFGLAVFVAPFASSLPDGVEAIAARLGFDSREVSALPAVSPFEGYTVRGLTSPRVATAIAGTAGIIVMFFAGYFIARMIASRGASGEAMKESEHAPRIP